MRGRSILLVALLLGGRAAAEPDESNRVEAKRLKDLGAAAITRGDNFAALELFQAANRLFPSPNLRFNVALALNNLGRHAEAATEYDLFLTEATGDTSRAAIDHASAHVAEATRRLARLAVQHDLAGAEVRVDGRPVGQTPLPRPLWLLPGNHTLLVAHPSRAPRTIDLTLLAGELRTLTLEADAAVPPALSPAAAPSPSPSDTPQSRRKRALGWGLGAGALVVVGLGVGIVVGVNASTLPASDLGPIVFRQ